MKSKVFTLAIVAVVAFALMPGLAFADEADLAAGSANMMAQASGSPDVKAMHRLYNPNSGEHFYTADAYECDDVIDAGWRYEGIGWYAPSSSNTPVYRLYNPNAGDHHYTTSAEERDNLVRVGWRYEGIGWYSDDGKAVALLRQYNPNARAGSHNFTTSSEENANLVRVGWRGEGVAWYGTARDEAARARAMFDQYGHGLARGAYLAAFRLVDIDADGDDDMVMLKFSTEGQWCDFLVYRYQSGSISNVLSATVYGAWSKMTAYGQRDSIVTEAAVHGTAGRSYSYYKQSGEGYALVASRTLPSANAGAWEYYVQNGSGSAKVSQATFNGAVTGMEAGVSVVVEATGFSSGANGWTTFRQGKRV